MNFYGDLLHPAHVSTRVTIISPGVLHSDSEGCLFGVIRHTVSTAVTCHCVLTRSLEVHELVVKRLTMRVTPAAAEASL